MRDIKTTVRAVQVNRQPSDAAPFGPPDEVIVGRDVLELVSSAMYVDPMAIYREYIQNAADAVDAARQAGLLKAGEPGRVDIEVDATARTVRIRDNGIGVGRETFVRRLSAIGASAKRNTTARGFRGVGRLAGLGYAQELVFRSRAAGEPLVSELRWDCRRLKTALRSQEGNESVADLVRNVVTTGLADSAGYPDRFFEVELRGVIRLKGDRLMSPHALADYIGQVGPVPFSPEFRLGADIAAALRAVGCSLDLDVRVSGIDGPVYRPHRDTFAINESRQAAFSELELIEVLGMDGGLAGLAWVLHHDYEGAIPPTAQVKGLRLRSGNIQVGDHALLEELFPEARFNAWSVGEIHVLDRRIIPNARRDHFEQNANFSNLVNNLLPVARRIARLCRTGSVRRRWLRQFHLHRAETESSIAVIDQRAGTLQHRRAMSMSVEQKLSEMDRIAAMEVLSEDGPDVLVAVVGVLRDALRKAMSDIEPGTSLLARLPAGKRGMYERLFELVYSCSSSKASAKALVDRMLTKIINDEIST